MTITATSRRRFLRTAAAVPMLPALSALPSVAMAATANTGGAPKPVSDTVLQWLDGAPPARFEGATLGVPPQKRRASGAYSK